MDLGYGPEHEAFRAEVREFLESEWGRDGAPAEPERERRESEFRRKATGRGYLNRGVPRRYGGSEQTPDVLRAQIIREEFGRARAPLEVPGAGMMMVVPTLLECGAEWQKEHFIPPTVAGEYRWAQGYSEPGAGSDLASLKTRAERVGDEWTIHGQKIWTSYAREADYFFMLVRTEPDAPKHAGISYLLVPADQPGIEIQPLKQITGESQFNQVFFDGARTPADWIVGERGQGWQVSRTTLRHERGHIGGADRSLQLWNSLMRLAGRSRCGDSPALDDPRIRDLMVQVLGYLRAQEYSGFTLLTRAARGQEAGLLETTSKLQYSRIAALISKLALQLIGDSSLLAPGLQPERGDERWLNQFMGSLGMAIAGGTSNIQRNLVAERGLGLPRDAPVRGEPSAAE
ncbi:MAG: acyl-CoA dehydrogenase family protein [Proteobacteria bacterium]|nr:acyl-CoA dehydrogenase family protein [Pseudomonadota bacterium]